MSLIDVIVATNVIVVIVVIGALFGAYATFRSVKDSVTLSTAIVRFRQLLSLSFILLAIAAPVLGNTIKTNAQHDWNANAIQHYTDMGFTKVTGFANNQASLREGDTRRITLNLNGVTVLCDIAVDKNGNFNEQCRDPFKGGEAFSLTLAEIKAFGEMKD